MPTFHDALSGEKRKLNVPQRTHTVILPKSWCDGAKWGHDWPDLDDDFCKCTKCGATILFVRALRNIDKPKQ